MENSSLFWSQHAIPKYSKGPMTAHQKDLPKQPLPPLLKSLKKYLDAIRPLVTAEEYRRTAKIVCDFSAKDGDGEKLYSILQEHYATLDNWIVDRWAKGQLLMRRSAISPVNTTSAFILKIDFMSQKEQLRFTSEIVYSILDFQKIIDCHQVKPDTFRGKLMDMSQYFLLFSTAQIPFKHCDNFIHYGDHTRSSRHFVVARRNKFFKINAFNKDGTPLSIEYLNQQLQIILSETDDDCPVGILTSQDRNVWANVYLTLCKDEVNRQTVETIQSALFILCLDKSVGDSIHEDLVTRNMHNLLHGCGPYLNGGNRWFDCGLQVIITDDGIIGLNTGSSPLEAQPFQRMLEHSVFKTIASFNKWKAEEKNSETSSFIIQKPRQLRFNLSNLLLEDIEIAKLNFRKACDDVDIEILEFHDCGKKFLKSHNISVDSFVQMAYQLTFYRLHGNNGVVCSVVTLHNFYRGHYDLLHSTTSKSIEFCKAMLDESATDERRFETLQKALQMHKNMIEEELKGYGINYLMFGLKKAAEENNLELPEIFEDVAHSAYFNVRLISSQIPGMDILPVFFSYGPFAENGYGCPYFVYPDKLHFCIFSLKHSTETNSKLFAKVLKNSLVEMKNIIRKFSNLID